MKNTIKKQEQIITYLESKNERLQYVNIISIVINLGLVVIILIK